jgi:hypothetical protein
LSINDTPIASRGRDPSPPLLKHGLEHAAREKCGVGRVSTAERRSSRLRGSGRAAQVDLGETAELT